MLKFEWTKEHTVALIYTCVTILLAIPLVLVILFPDILGGALGGTLGMRVFHHKTKHKEFRFGFPALLCLQCAAVVYLILIWKQVI